MWRKLTILLAAVLVLTACSTPQPPQPESSVRTTVLKLGFNQGESHPQYQALTKLAADLKQQTSGRYDIKIYATEKLGSQSEVLKSVSSGTVDLMMVSGPLLEQYNPDFVVYDLPYIFDSPEAQKEVLGDADVNRKLYESLTASHNICVLAGFYAGTRNFYTVNKAITLPQDLAGLKIRVQEADSQAKIIELLGGVPVKLGAGQTYEALNTGSIDGAENNEGFFHELSHDTLAKNFSYTRHAMIPDYLVMSTKVLNAMSSNDRQTLLDLVAKARAESDNAMSEYLEKAKKDAEAAGATFREVNQAAFKEKLASFTQTEAEKNGETKKLSAAVQEANRKYPGD